MDLIKKLIIELAIQNTIQTNSTFDLHYKNLNNKKKSIKNINIKLIGEHNILNATASYSSCLNIGVKIEIIKKALKNFSGFKEE